MLYHILKGIPGQSSLSINKIDVFKIIDMNYHKRLFMMVDRKHPYTLRINYSHIEIEPPMFPFLGNNVTSESIITKRYKNLKEIHEEIDEIKRKQMLFHNLINKIPEDKYPPSISFIKIKKLT
jgi:hypothetical protein